MIINKECVVIFPVYRSISECEKECFEQAVQMTNGFKKIIIAPRSYQLDQSFGSVLSSLDIVRFDDHFFKGIAGYNLLMLSEKFYESFSDYKYMLIHQSDAYLFSPKLQYWCDQDYDYLGAPWLRSANTAFKIKIRIFKLKYFSFLYSEEERDIKRSYLIYNQVGNGGLSLRKINTFINVLKKVRDQQIKKYKETSEFNYLEDVFWSIEAPKINKEFKKPDHKTALKFSIEQNPQLAYEINNRELPFGCHGYNIIETEWWKQFIPPLQNF